MYKERTYRRWVKNEGLVTFEVKEAQTDLLISASKDLAKQAREALLNYRQDIESYIKIDDSFRISLEPIKVKEGAPLIVKAMSSAATKADVGPMAAIAGAVAEFVGRDLLRYSEEIIVENGGDIFIRSGNKKVMGIYAGEDSPYTGKLAVEIGPSSDGLGICTSSGTVSHSLNFGKADAAMIISDDTAFADALATATGNMVKDKESIKDGIDFAKSFKDVKGVLILVGNKMGSWGSIKFV